MICPRGQTGMLVQMKHAAEAYWRDDDTCNYCGNLKPEVPPAPTV